MILRGDKTSVYDPNTATRSQEMDRSDTGTWIDSTRYFGGNPWLGVMYGIEPIRTNRPYKSVLTKAERRARTAKNKQASKQRRRNRK